MYEKRFYRQELIKNGWFTYEVSLAETDLHITSKQSLDEGFIYKRIKEYRDQIQEYIDEYPEFKNTLSGFHLKGKPVLIVKEMIENTFSLDIGPMASVAGAIAESLGRDLVKITPEFVIENGGDICFKKKDKLCLGVYAGLDNPVNDLRILVKGEDKITGVCSSSSILGHSLSLGNADLVTIISESVILADALATKIANRVNTEADIGKKIEEIKIMPQIKGALIIKNNSLGLWGDIELG
jgi:uncharacterized protein